MTAEREARECYLVGLATLCAGTTHEINTPLSTMIVSREPGERE